MRATGEWAMSVGAGAQAGSVTTDHDSGGSMGMMLSGQTGVEASLGRTTRTVWTEGLIGQNDPSGRNGPSGPCWKSSGWRMSGT